MFGRQLQPAGLEQGVGENVVERRIVRLPLQPLLRHGDGVLDIVHLEQRGGEIAVDRRDLGRLAAGPFQMEGGGIRLVEAQHHGAEVEGDFRIFGQQSGGVGERARAHRQIALREHGQGLAFDLVVEPPRLSGTCHGEVVVEIC